MRLLQTSLAVLITVGLMSACTFEGEARTVSRKSSSSSSSLRTRAVSSKASSVKHRFLFPRSKGSSSIAKPLAPPVGLKIPVLVYHHIRPDEGWPAESWSSKMSITPEGFERHMQWLVDHGYTSIDLDTYIAIIRGDVAGPSKPVVITFDDNNLSQYDVALPMMEKHGMMGVYYIVAGRIDSNAVINREKIRDLHIRGMDIQSHTMTHTVLPNVDMARLDYELTESKKILEEVTGKKINHIAYPGTAHNQTVRDHTKAAGYITGSIMDPRAATEKDDLMKLPRIMMIDETNLEKVLP